MTHAQWRLRRKTALMYCSRNVPLRRAVLFRSLPPMHIYALRRNAPSQINMSSRLLSSLGIFTQKLQKRAIAQWGILSTHAGHKLLLKQGAGYTLAGIYSRGVNSLVACSAGCILLSPLVTLVRIILWLHTGRHFTTTVNVTALVSKERRKKWKREKGHG